MFGFHHHWNKGLKEKKKPREGECFSGLCVEARCDDAADSPQIPVSPHWSRGSRRAAASQSRRSAGAKGPKHVRSVTTGCLRPCFFITHLKYLDATQGEPQREGGLHFLLVLVRRAKASSEMLLEADP